MHIQAVPAARMLLHMYTWRGGMHKEGNLLVLQYVYAQKKALVGAPLES